ncbi:MAG: hypothetical protein ACLFUI_04505 [Halanaerobiales bacterium]
MAKSMKQLVRQLMRKCMVLLVLAAFLLSGISGYAAEELSGREIMAGINNRDDGDTAR